MSYPGYGYPGQYPTAAPPPFAAPHPSVATQSSPPVATQSAAPVATQSLPPAETESTATQFAPPVETQSAAPIATQPPSPAETQSSSPVATQSPAHHTNSAQNERLVQSEVAKMAKVMFGKGRKQMIEKVTDGFIESTPPITSWRNNHRSAKYLMLTFTTLIALLVISAFLLHATYVKPNLERCQSARFKGRPSQCLEEWKDGAVNSVHYMLAPVLVLSVLTASVCFWMWGINNKAANASASEIFRVETESNARLLMAVVLFSSLLAISAATSIGVYEMHVKRDIRDCVKEARAAEDNATDDTMHEAGRSAIKSCSSTTSYFWYEISLAFVAVFALLTWTTWSYRLFKREPFFVFSNYTTEAMQST